MLEDQVLQRLSEVQLGWEKRRQVAELDARMQTFGSEIQETGDASGYTSVQTPPSLEGPCADARSSPSSRQRWGKGLAPGSPCSESFACLLCRGCAPCRSVSCRMSTSSTWQAVNAQDFSEDAREMREESQHDEGLGCTARTVCTLQELTEMSEDLTSLWQRARSAAPYRWVWGFGVDCGQVQSSELGLDSMAEAVGRICEDSDQSW